MHARRARTTLSRRLENLNRDAVSAQTASRVRLSSFALPCPRLPAAVLRSSNALPRGLSLTQFSISISCPVARSPVSGYRYTADGTFFFCPAFCTFHFCSFGRCKVEFVHAVTMTHTTAQQRKFRILKLTISFSEVAGPVSCRRCVHTGGGLFFTCTRFAELLLRKQRAFLSHTFF